MAEIGGWPKLEHPTIQNFIYLKFGQIRAADFHPKINMAYFLRATNLNLGGTRWNFF